jgi:hypothetical protein
MITTKCEVVVTEEQLVCDVKVTVVSQVVGLEVTWSGEEAVWY